MYVDVLLQIEASRVVVVVVVEECDGY